MGVDDALQVEASVDSLFQWAKYSVGLVSFKSPSMVCPNILRWVGRIKNDRILRLVVRNHCNSSPVSKQHHRSQCQAQHSQ